MEYDVHLIISVVGLGIILFFAIVKIPGSMARDSAALIRLLIFGFSFLLFATVGNSLREGRWTIEYIFNFLCLKKAGDWLFRVSAGLSYIVIFGGIAALLSAIIENLKLKKQK